MVKAFHRYIALLLTALFAAVLCKNCLAYRRKSLKFKLFKSICDWSIISFLSWKLPVLLVAWAVNLVVRPITSHNMKITVAVFVGMLFNSISISALEVLALVSVFSVDIITGNCGFLGYIRQQWTEEKYNERRTNSPLEM